MKNLLQLAIQNREHPPVIRCEAGGDIANIYMKGVISSEYGVSANALREAMASADGKKVNLYVNSPGGDVFEGREMQGVIAAYSGEVTAIIQGVAASAATFVTMAAKHVHMVRGSRYMIHNGWTLAMGDKRVMAEMGALLAGFDNELAAEYAAKTGVEQSKIISWMDAETWFTSEQALEHGFIDQINSNTQNSAMAQTWNLSAYANAPKQESPAQPDINALAAQQIQMNKNRLRLFETQI